MENRLAQTNWNKFSETHTGPQKVGKGHPRNKSAEVRRKLGISLDIHPREQDRRDDQYAQLINSLKRDGITAKKCNEILDKIWSGPESNLLSGGALGIDQITRILTELEQNNTITFKEKNILLNWAREEKERQVKNTQAKNIYTYTTAHHTNVRDTTESTEERLPKITVLTKEDYQSQLIQIIQNPEIRNTWLKQIKSVLKYSSGLKNEANDILSDFSEDMIKSREQIYKANPANLDHYLRRALTYFILRYIEKSRKQPSRPNANDKSILDSQTTQDSKHDRSSEDEILGAKLLDYILGKEGNADGNNFGHTLGRGANPQNLERYKIIIQGRIQNFTSLNIARELLVTDTELAKLYPNAIKQLSQKPNLSIQEYLKIKKTSTPAPEIDPKTVSEIIKLNNLIDQLYKRGMDLAKRELRIK
ncbi:MAG: hypothetical protein HYV41_05090 [Candidatus Magasanikbacteria bacterium]|nr:hypothetical protein [Candidatus Magasanikbacteria bacterium]